MILTNIRLEEAIDKVSDHLSWEWSVLELHLEGQKLPDGANGCLTFVRKTSDKSYVVGFFWTREKTHVRITDRFSDLEEIQKKYPKLFELEGLLVASP